MNSEGFEESEVENFNISYSMFISLLILCVVELI